MSLTQVTAFQPATYINAAFALDETYTLTSGGPQTGTGELNMMPVDGGGDAIYLAGRDQILTTCKISSAADAGLANAFCRLDPEFQLLNAPGDVNIQVETTLAYVPRYYMAGTYDPLTGQQLVFCSDTSETHSDVRILNLDTLEPAATAFSTDNGDFSLAASFPTIGNEGYWVDASPHGLIFDGLTDGIAGETLATGPNVYPDGLYLVNASASEWNSRVFTGRSWVWCDIRTRFAVGRLGGGLASSEFPTGFPAHTTVSVPSELSNPQSEPPIGSDSFVWAARQYMPDGDATYIQPKGLLFMNSRTSIPTPLSGPNSLQRIYIRFVEFNPLGIAAAPGQPERVHGRIRFTSRWNAEHSPHFDLAGQTNMTQASGGQIRGLIFDQQRNRFVWGLRDHLVTGAAGAEYGDVENTTVAYLSLAINPDVVTAPIARDVPRTGTVVRYQSVVAGDLAEPATGTSVDWTLSRLSTEGEVLNALTFPGTSTVANGPIDTEQDGTAILQIFSDGSLLELTTDYTVVAATGVITWVTDQSGATLVTATYEHRATPATPAHGSLITSSSITDTNGIAETSVFYPDNDLIVGTLDTLEVTLT